MRSTTLRWFAAILFLTGPTLAAQSATCSATFPATAEPFTATRIAELAGSYELNLIDPDRASNNFTLDLVLWPNDSLHRFRYLRTIGREAGERILGGSAHSQDTLRTWFRHWTQPEDGNITVVYLRGRLQIGTIDATDGWRDIMRIQRIGAEGFGGDWGSDLGIGVMIDRDGKKLPNPGGYFCARRVPAFPDAPRPPH